MRSGPPADVDPPIVEPRRLGVLGERSAIVVDGQMIDAAQRVLELLQPYLVVDLTEALVLEEQRQHLQLEEAPGRRCTS